MLERAGKGQSVAPSGVQAGGLSSFRLHLARLYEAKSPRLALVVVAERGALLILSYVESRFELTLLLHQGSAFLEEALAELFGELRTLRIPLPDFWDDAAQRVIDLLIRGYGLTEGARLLFHYQESKQSKSQV